jgi:hypothetical protein
MALDAGPLGVYSLPAADFASPRGTNASAIRDRAPVEEAIAGHRGDVQFRDLVKELGPIFHERILDQGPMCARRCVP